MSLADFFSPLDPGRFAGRTGFTASQYGSKLEVYSDTFPDLDEGGFDIALIGVQEDRNSVGNQGCGLGPDYIREQFYQLNEGPYNTRIADLGNIRAGNRISDTYVALRLVVAELVKKNILPVILGGGQDLTYAQYIAYEELEQKVDLLIIDSRFDLEPDEERESPEPTSQSYMNKIFLHTPNFLFNFSNIGYQTYFVNQESLRFMEKLYFDVNRLGDVHGKISMSEPVIRNANVISFDLSAIRSSDAAANANASPNGFYGEEACQMCRYAGMNDKLTSIGFYEFNPAFDQNGQTAMLMAQMLWYLMDGFYNRKKDFPLQPKSQYLIYRAPLNDNMHELIFVKSKKTDRWWMQVPYPSGRTKNERYHLVPCRYEDYQTAVAGEMPDLWWRTYQKLV
jgi:formiminoglutamase